MGKANEVVAKNIKARREKRGLSQRQVAELAAKIGPHLPWHQSRISKIESGHQPIFVDDVVVLAEIFRCSPSTLLKGV